MDAKLFTTDLRAGLYWYESTPRIKPTDPTCRLSVYPSVRRQLFEGFGGAFTEASAFCWHQLSSDQQERFLDACFGEDGLRYTLGRTHMGSCDFSLGHYDCLPDSSDLTLKSFCTDRDDRYLIPMILAAQKAAGKPIRLMLSPWSPPSFMKTNGDRDHGGTLKAEYRQLWADCMAKYVLHYRSRGCDVRLISVQNEPDAVQTWDSCIFSGEEEGRFAVDYLAPALETAGCGDVKILAWDHNKELLFRRARETLSVPGAQETIAGFAVHWYTGDHFDALRYVGETWPDKELWFTEGCVEYHRFGERDAVQKAEMYAHDILGNLSAGICGSIDWNLLLDAEGGPNHVRNFCEAPIMMTKDGAGFTLMGEYYYIGQFSRFILPGAIRLGSSVWNAGLESVVFENSGGERVAVLLNRSEESLPVCVSEDAVSGLSFEVAAHSIATLCWRP